MRIYVASSWRNTRQPQMVGILRQHGFDVYDFRNPCEGEHGFSWSDIDPDWKQWSNKQFIQALEHRVARKGFLLDMIDLITCDACLLVLPCGRSAHLEAGFCIGEKKPTVILLDPLSTVEPELMYKMSGLVTTDIFQAITIFNEYRK